MLTREAPQPVRVGIGAAEFDEAGRYLEVDLPEITIANSRFLPHEREWLGGVSAAGCMDVVLSLHPGVDGAYSWWSYRSRATTAAGASTTTSRRRGWPPAPSRPWWNGRRATVSAGRTTPR